METQYQFETLNCREVVTAGVASTSMRRVLLFLLK